MRNNEAVERGAGIVGAGCRMDVRSTGSETMMVVKRSVLRQDQIEVAATREPSASRGSRTNEAPK
jgi:hypothetical protein